MANDSIRWEKISDTDKRVGINIPATDSSVGGATLNVNGDISASSIETDEFAVATGSIGTSYTHYTSNGFNLTKIGNIVNIHCEIRAIDTTDTGWLVIATMPTGFRPSNVIPSYCMLFSGTYVDPVPMPIRFETDGRIRIYRTSTTLSLDRIILKDTFII